MRRRWVWLIGLIACLLASGGFYLLATGMMRSIYTYRSPLHESPPGPGEAVGEPLSQRVVFVLIDALRIDTAYDPQIMPFLAQLRQQGAWAEMHSREPSYSATGYSVIFTGAWPELSDGPVFNPTTEEFPAWTQDNLFTAVWRKGLQNAVAGYEWFEKLIPQEAVAAGYYTLEEDWRADRAVVDAALPWLQRGEYALIFIHLDQVDYAGHYEGGPQDPNWATAANRVDALLREIASQLDLTRDTLFVCSDHGQIDSGGHGGNEPDVIREPFVLVGAGVRPGEYGVVNMVDIAPTLASILGVSLPASSQGRVRTEMLTFSSSALDQVEAAQAAQQVKLVAAYANAVERKVEVTDGPDIVNQTQQAMESVRKELISAHRLPRLLFAGAISLIPLAWLGWTWNRDTLWYILGAAAYHLVFNLWYVLVDGKGYSFSYVSDAIDFVLGGLVAAFIAFGSGWLLATLGSRAFHHRAHRAGEFNFKLVLVTLYTLCLPVLWSYAWDGLFVGRFLPDFNRTYVALLAMTQGLAIGLLGLPFAGLATVFAKLIGRRR